MTSSLCECKLRENHQNVAARSLGFSNCYQPPVVGRTSALHLFISYTRISRLLPHINPKIHPFCRSTFLGSPRHQLPSLPVLITRKAFKNRLSTPFVSHYYRALPIAQQLCLFFRCTSVLVPADSSPHPFFLGLPSPLLPDFEEACRNLGAHLVLVFLVLLAISLCLTQEDHLTTGFKLMLRL